MTSTYPAASDLIRTSIVSIDLNHKKVTTNTLQVAEYFGKRPSEVNRRIKLLSQKGLCKFAPSYYLNKQRKKQKYYVLNREQFLLVVMGFTGDLADQFKADFIQIFNQQEAELQEWRQQRELASTSTKQANDSVHKLRMELVKIIPTSNKCKMLFIHIQQSINKVATGSAKTAREEMTRVQLLHVAQLEKKVNAEIERLTANGVPPEQLRDDVLAMIKLQNIKGVSTADQIEGDFEE